MAEIANPNIPTYYLDGVLVTAREGETWPLGNTPDFAGGMNRAASCAEGLGINTGDYDPKASDWPRIEHTAGQKSQHIGQVQTALLVDQDPDLNDEVAFVQADGATAPDAVLDATTGAVNKTGKTVPADSWAWGVIPVA